MNVRARRVDIAMHDSSQSGRRSMQRPIVLLAEPDDDSRAMYADYLAVRGFEVIVVTTSDDALLEAPHVDVIVTGARLAGTVDGIELVRRLRGNDQSGRRP